MNDFKLFMEAIKPDMEAGLIKGKNGRLVFGIDKIKYAEQNRKVPEYTMLYMFDRKTKRLFSSYGA